MGERYLLYQSTLNDEIKRELGGRSPFEVYFGRKSNYLLQYNHDSDPDSEGDVAEISDKIWPKLTTKELFQLDQRRQLLTTSTFESKSSKC